MWFHSIKTDWLALIVGESLLWENNLYIYTLLRACFRGGYSLLRGLCCDCFSVCIVGTTHLPTVITMLPFCSMYSVYFGYNHGSSDCVFVAYILFIGIQSWFIWFWILKCIWSLFNFNDSLWKVEQPLNVNKWLLNETSIIWLGDLNLIPWMTKQPTTAQTPR